MSHCFFAAFRNHLQRRFETDSGNSTKLCRDRGSGRAKRARGHFSPVAKRRISVDELCFENLKLASGDLSRIEDFFRFHFRRSRSTVLGVEE